MTDKPTTGEWMASTVEIMFMANPKNAHYAIAEAHNAALVAHVESAVAVLKRQYREQLATQDKYISEIRTTTYSDLEKQLAAEREKVAELEQQNKTFRAAQKACEDCDGPTMAEVQQMREQLAAERKKVADAFQQGFERGAKIKP